MTRFTSRVTLDGMSDIDETTRPALHALFNNAAFADVARTAHRITRERPDGTVTTRLVAAELRISDSVVRPVMTRLVISGLLDELPKSGAVNGPRYFHPRHPQRWEALLSLINDITKPAKHESLDPGPASSRPRTVATQHPPHV